MMVVDKDAVNFCDENKNLDISVVGALGDLEIVEETCISEDDAPTESSAVARPVVSAPVFGTVTVSNSENVQFGNNTYFQGPVTIKQIIQNKTGIDNVSYDKTDDENVSKPPLYKESNNENGSVSFVMKKWHKVTVSAVLFIVASICGIVFGLQMIPDRNEDEPQSGQVAGSWLQYSPGFTIMVIVITPFISAWASYRLLTINMQFSFRFLKWQSENVTNKSGLIKNQHKQIAGEQLLIAPDHLRIVSRLEWLAQPETGPLDKLILPAPWVIICHTATSFCHTQSSCVYNVRLVQSYHVESRHWYDIAYNYLVGGDGSAYFGRGWDYIGAHTLGYNKYSIAIAFIGTFTNEAPPQKQLDACKKLIARGVAAGKIAKDYKLFAHRHLMSTQSPGDKLVEIIQHWPNFVRDDNITNLLPNY